MDRVFEHLVYKVRGYAESRRQCAAQRAYIRGGIISGLFGVGQKGGISPQGLTVAAPQHTDLPPWQCFAGVPLALTMVEHAAGCIPSGQASGHFPRRHPFGWTISGGGPFLGLHVADGDERGLTAHGEAHITCHQYLVNVAAQRVNGRPLVLGVRQGDARIFVDTAHHIAVFQRCFARLHHAGDGSRRGWLRGTGQRDVTFAGEQAGGGIEPDPPGTRHVHLGPGM